MSRRALRLAAGLAAAAVLAPAARAQDGADPIGDLLGATAAPPATAPAPPAASVPAAAPPPAAVPPAPAPPPAPPPAASWTPPPYAASPALPAAPIPYAAPTPYAPARPQATYTPGVPYDYRPPAPAYAPDAGYDARLRASSAAAQGQQGPLDGSWTLAAADGGDLYGFELVDRYGGVMEGAWRDLRRPGALSASGFVDYIERMGPGLTLRFRPDGRGETAVATLSPRPDGRWAGELDDGGRRRDVILRRN